MTGRLYHEFSAQFAAITMFLGFNMTFFPQFIMGWQGMPRRYHIIRTCFRSGTCSRPVARRSGGRLYHAAHLSRLVAVLRARRAGDNPWDATGLEWQTTSPPPKAKFRASTADHLRALHVSRDGPPAEAGDEFQTGQAPQGDAP